MLSRLGTSSMWRPSTLQRMAVIALDRSVSLRSAAQRSFSYGGVATRPNRFGASPVFALGRAQRNLFQQPLWHAKDETLSLKACAAFSSGASGPPGRKRRNENEEEEARRRAENKELPADAPRSRLGQVLMGIPVLGALFGKSKYLIVGAKLLKLKSLASMMLSVGVYSMFFGLPYAVGVVGIMVLHEGGHALVMLQRGIPVGATTFIPFVGASVSMKERPKDAYESALVAFGGPVLGGIGAAGVALAGVAMNSQLLLAIADFGFFINMINMMPLGMMDGGHIAGAIHKQFLLLGLAAGTAAVVVLPVYNPMVYIILAGSAYSTWQRFYGKSEEREGFYDIPNETKIAIGTGYLATIAALFAAWQWTKKRLMSPHQLQQAKADGTLEEKLNAPGGYINEAEDPFDIDADSGFTIDTPSNAELLETKRRHNYEMRQAEAERIRREHNLPYGPRDDHR